MTSEISSPASAAEQPGPRPMQQALSLSALAALLLIVSFPDTRLWPLAFVALIPFGLATEGQTWKKGLILGGLFGFVLQSYLMFWANFFGFPAFLFLAGYRAYPYIAIGWGWATLSRLPFKWRFAGSLGCWISVEYYQTCGPFGCTWGMVSHTLAQQTSLLQICSLGGPWLLSAVVVACNLLFLETLRKRRGWPLLAAAALVGATYAFGALRLSHAPPTPAKGEPPNSLEVGAVQVNMGRDIKWNPSYAEMSLSRLEEMTMLAAADGSKLTIWPETSVPYRGFRSDMDLTARMGTLARVTSTNLVIGSIEMKGDAAEHTFNTASLVGYKGDFLDRYDKQRLVPGGEYLPFESWLRPFSIFDRVMRYLPGQGSGVLTCTFDEEPKVLRLGVLICFESMVPNLAADRVRNGAQALSVATNDGWFGESSAITHHFEMAIFRAVETARPTIQSGNTGISGVIDAYGRVLVHTKPNEKTYVVGPLIPGNEITPYVRWGDWVAWLGALIWLLASTFCRTKISLGRAARLLPEAQIHSEEV